MEPLVTIAIPDIAGSAARDAALASLARHTPEPYEVVLFVEDKARRATTRILPPCHPIPIATSRYQPLHRSALQRL